VGAVCSPAALLEINLATTFQDDWVDVSPRAPPYRVGSQSAPKRRGGPGPRGPGADVGCPDWIALLATAATTKRGIRKYQERCPKGWGPPEGQGPCLPIYVSEEITCFRIFFFIVGNLQVFCLNLLPTMMLPIFSLSYSILLYKPRWIVF